MEDKQKRPYENAGSYRGITWKDNYDLSRKLFKSPSAVSAYLRRTGKSKEEYIDGVLKDMTYEEYCAQMLIEKKIDKQSKVRINIDTASCADIDHIDISGNLKSSIMIDITFKK